MKDISDQEVTEHLKRLNGWWTSGRIDVETEKLQSRAYLPAVQRLLTDTKLRRAVVLLGPRRVGKTVLIRHLIRALLAAGHSSSRIAYVEMDHPLLRGRSLESLIRLMKVAAADEEDGLRYFFFDEIQYLKDWEQDLKSITDHSPQLRLLVSGSAAAALKRKSNESGAGRFTDFLLPPLTFQEFLTLATDNPEMSQEGPGHFRLGDLDKLNKQFEDYINFGGYPELALSESVRSDPARFIKSDIVDKVLLRDLPQLYGIQDIQELNSLFTLLAYNTAETVSPEDLSKKCGVGKPTIQKYIEYLEAAFLLKRVFRIDQSGKRYQRDRNFKIYLTNPSMRTGLFGPMTADKEGFGHLVETAIYAQTFHEDARLHYARWGSDDNEVDMIRCDAALKPINAVEIKWTDKHASFCNESSALIKFCKHNALTHATISTRTRINMQTIGGVRVRAMPSAVLAYMYGANATRGRMEQLEFPEVRLASEDSKAEPSGE
jgi:uncharacterized protein